LKSLHTLKQTQQRYIHIDVEAGRVNWEDKMIEGKQELFFPILLSAYFSSFGVYPRPLSFWPPAPSSSCKDFIKELED